MGSEVIDNRVVTMEFDNKEFQTKIKETLETIEKFDKKTADSFDDSAKQMSSRLDDLENQFSAKSSIIRGIWEQLGAEFVSVGTQAIRKIENLLTKNARSGFAKYSDMTQAVQTIKYATGKSVDDIKVYLDDLMKYTDETSYNFVDMVSNIGKFTNQKVALEDATEAMKGIGNWAATAGQGIQQASSAMYNLSQALSRGYVQLIDWKSIENANMSTIQFKEALLETAKAVGTVTSAGKTKKGNFDVMADFNDSLNKGWLTTDVLLGTLKKYADTSTDFGQKAFEAAQKATTLEQAIQAVEDAASTGWLKTFEIVVGDLDEAIELFTDSCTELATVFTDMAEARNTMLTEWKDAGGRDKLINSLKTIYRSVRNIFTSADKGFRTAFPNMGMTSDRLLTMTDAIERFANKMNEIFEITVLLSGDYKAINQLLENGNRTLGETIKEEVHFERELSEGMKGDDVKFLQEMLNDYGPYELKITGVFDEPTKKALEDAEKKLAEAGELVSEDGIYDIDDARALQSSLGVIAKTAGTVTSAMMVANKLGLDSEDIDPEVISKALNAYADILEGRGQKYTADRIRKLSTVVTKMGPGAKIIMNASAGIADSIKNIYTMVSGIIRIVKPFVQIPMKLLSTVLELVFGTEKIGRTIINYFSTRKILEWASAITHIGFLNGPLSKVLQVLGLIGGLLGDFNIDIGSWFDQAQKDAEAWVEGFIPKMKGWIQAKFDKIHLSFADFMGAKDFDSAVEGFKKGVGEIYESIKTKIIDLGLDKKISAAWESLKESASNAWESIKKIFSGGEAGEKLQTTFADVSEVVKGKLEALATWFSDKFGIVSEHLIAFFNNLPSRVEKVKEWFENSKIVANVKTIWGNLKEMVKGFFEKLPGYYEKVKGWFSSSETGSSIGSFFGRIFEGITGFFANLPQKWESVKTFFSQIFSNFKDSGLIDKVVATWNKITEAVRNLFSTLFGKEGKEASDEKKNPLKNIWDSIIGVVPTVIEAALNLFTKVGDSIANFITTIPDKLASVGEFFSKLFGIFSSKGSDGVSESSIQKAETITDKSKNFFGKIGEVFELVKSYLGPATKAAFDYIDKIGPGGILTIVGAIVGLKGISKIAGAFGQFGKLAGNFAGVGKTTKKLFKGLTDLTENTDSLVDVIKDTIKKRNAIKMGAKVFLEIAAGFAIIAGAIWLLSSKKWSELWPALVVVISSIAAVFLAVVGLNALLVKNKSMAKSVEASSKSFIGIGIALAAFAAGIKVLGEMNPSNLVQGIAAMVLVFATLVGGFYILSKFGGNKSMDIRIRGIVGLCLGLVALVGVLWVLTKFPFRDMMNGLLKVATILGVFMLIIAVTSRIGGGSMSFKGIFGLSTAVLILVGVVKLLASFSDKVFQVGVARMWMLLGAITVSILVINLAQKAGTKTTSFGTFMGLSLSIMLLAGMVVLLGTIPGGTLAKGVATVGLIMLSMSVLVSSFGKISKFKRSTGKIIATFAGVILLLGSVVAGLLLLKDVPVEKIISLTGGLAAVIAAMALMLSSFPAAGGYTVGLKAGVAIAEMVGVIALIVAAIGGISKIPGVKNFMESAMEAIGELIGSVFVGLAKSIEKASKVDIDTASIDKIVKSMEQIIKLSNTMAQDEEGHTTVGSAFANLISSVAFNNLMLCMPNFCTAVTKLASDLTGVTVPDITKATDAVGKIIELSNSLEAFGIKDGETVQEAIAQISGTLKFIELTGDTPFGNFLNKEIPAFISGVTDLNEKLAGIGDLTGNVKIATTAVGDIEKLASDINTKLNENTVGFTSLTGKTPFEQFVASLPSFAGNVLKANAIFRLMSGGLYSSDGFGNAKKMATDLVGLSNALSPITAEDVKIAETGEGSKFKQFIDSIPSLAKNLSKANTEFSKSKVNESKVQPYVAFAKQLVNLANSISPWSFTGSTSWIESFFEEGKTSPFEKFINNIEKFAEELKKAYDKISEVKVEQDDGHTIEEKAQAIEDAVSPILEFVFKSFRGITVMDKTGTILEQSATPQQMLEDVSASFMLYGQFLEYVKSTLDQIDRIGTIASPDNLVTNTTNIVTALETIAGFMTLLHDGTTYNFGETMTNNGWFARTFGWGKTNTPVDRLVEFIKAMSLGIDELNTNWDVDANLPLINSIMASFHGIADLASFINEGFVWSGSDASISAINDMVMFIANVITSFSESIDNNPELQTALISAGEKIRGLILSGLSGAADDAEGAGSAATIASVIAQINEMLESGINCNPTITPVLEITDDFREKLAWIQEGLGGSIGGTNASASKIGYRNQNGRNIGGESGNVVNNYDERVSFPNATFTIREEADIRKVAIAIEQLKHRNSISIGRNTKTVST